MGIKKGGRSSQYSEIGLHLLGAWPNISSTPLDSTSLYSVTSVWCPCKEEGCCCQQDRLRKSMLYFSESKKTKTTCRWCVEKLKEGGHESTSRRFSELMFGYDPISRSFHRWSRWSWRGRSSRKRWRCGRGLLWWAKGTQGGVTTSPLAP